MKTDFREMVEYLRQADEVAPGETSSPALALLGAIGALQGDELDVVGLVVERLQLGRTVYGQLDIASDGRDFAAEARDEAVDLLVYEAIGLLMRERGAIRTVAE